MSDNSNSSPSAPVRVLLLELLDQHHLLTVRQILDHFSSQGQDYNKTTVYRALEQLLADDAICKHTFGQNEAQYELRSHHHAHLVCERCGKVQIAPCSYQQPAEVAGFKVTHHHLELRGLCAACQQGDQTI